MATEQFTNNAQTTLNGSINATTTSIVVTSAVSFPSVAQYHIIIDNEIMLVTGGAGTTTWTVTRGNNLPAPDTTTNTTHATLATVTLVLTAGSLTGYVLNPVAGVTYSPTALLTLAGVVNNYGLTITAPSNAGQSLGELIQAGTNSSDYALRVQTQAGVDILAARGDGKVVLSPGTNLITPSSSGLTFNNALIVPPSLNGTVPTTAYGTVPIKLDDQLLSVAASSITFVNPIPTGFRHLLVEWYTRGDNASTSITLTLRVNNVSTGTYDYDYVQISGTTTAVPVENLAATGWVVGFAPGSTATANYFGQGEIKIKHYNSTVGNKIMFADNSWAAADTTGNQVQDRIMGKWRTTGTAITRLDLLPNAGNFIAGSVFTLWGIP